MLQLPFKGERESMNIDLTDAQWALIQPLLPTPEHRGRPRADDRRTLNGILYVLRTGCRWRDLPKQYGVSSTCWRRLERWLADGTWERVWRTLLATLDTWEKCIWAEALLTGACIPVPTKKGGRHVA